jgi:hypothetical protein
VEDIIENEASPNLSGDGSPYYVLMEAAVLWCVNHPEPIPREEDPSYQL